MARGYRAGKLIPLDQVQILMSKYSIELELDFFLFYGLDYSTRFKKPGGLSLRKIVMLINDLQDNLESRTFAKVNDRTPMSRESIILTDIFAMVSNGQTHPFRISGEEKAKQEHEYKEFLSNKEGVMKSIKRRRLAKVAEENAEKIRIAEEQGRLI